MSRTHSKVQLLAIIIIFLSLFITSLPQSQGATLPPVTEARLLFSWGDIQDTLAPSQPTEIWDGSITLSSGNMFVLRTLWFKDANDRLISKEGAKIDFNSDILSNYDGIYLKIVPTNDAASVTFTSTNGETLTTPLSYFIDHDDIVKTTKSGTSLKISKVFVRTGSSTNGSGTLLPTTFTPTKTLAGTGTILGDPSYLLYKDGQYLEKLSRSELTSLDFSKLTNIHGRLYDTLLLLGRDKIAELPPRVQHKAFLLEGLLPTDIADQAGISDPEDITEWKSLLTSIDEPLLLRLLDRFDNITPGLWKRIHDLPTEYKEALLHFSLGLKGDTASIVLPTYLDQLENLEILEQQLGQVKFKFAFDDLQKLKKMFSTLKKTLFYDNSNEGRFYESIQKLISSADAKTPDMLREELLKIQKIFDANMEGSTKRKRESGILPFGDVNEMAWYSTFVQSLYEDNIISGYKDAQGKSLGEYKPEQNVTVGETLKLLLVMMDKGQANHAPKNTKNTHHWAEGYLAKAEDLKLTIATLDLDLSRPITRQEVLRALLEVAGLSLPDYTSASFSDIDVSTLDGKYVEYAKQLGIVTGDAGAKTFRPKDNLNRAEMAKILLFARYYLMGK